MADESLYFCLITDTLGGPGGDGNHSDGRLSTDGKDIFVGGRSRRWITAIHSGETARLDGGSLRNVVVEPFSWSGVSGRVFVPVFRKLEILIVDDVGREVVSHRGRRPCKWMVGYETYRDVRHAVARANQLEGVRDGEPLPERVHEVVEEQVMGDLVEGQRKQRERW